MKQRYLTHEYLQKLLQFIVQEHLELKYGTVSRKHHDEARKMYKAAAKALWEPIDIKAPKRRGGQERDEMERAKLAIHLIKEEKMRPNTAYRTIATLYPAPDTSYETLIQQIRRNHKRMVRDGVSLEAPIFYLSSKPLTGLSLEVLEKDAQAQTLRDVLKRIEQKLLKPLS